MAALQFNLNGAPVAVDDVPPETTLLQWLRRRAGLPGTKEGCAEGDCGACTVALLDAEAHGGPAWRAVNSCLLLLPALHGQRVVTVEGLAAPAAAGGALHPVQAAMVEALGSQCGYCTPGVVMSLFEACYRRDLEAGWQLDDQLCGNLCRCTGYRPIRAAAAAVAGTCPADRFSAALTEAAAARAADQAAAQAALAAGTEAPAAASPLTYHAGGRSAAVPVSLDGLFAVLAENPGARLVCGATDLGLDVTKKGATFPCLVSLHGIAALRRIERLADGGWRFGATAMLSDVEAATDAELHPLARMIRFFGSRQIKNRATVAGNLCNASPIGDLAPVLLALGATAVILSAAGERRVPLDAFFLGYRKTALQPGEILGAVEVPPPHPEARMVAYKVSKRREMDISAVACGLYLETDEAGVVTAARFGFGGMAATPARARAAEAAVLGQVWSAEAAEAAAAALATDFTPLSDHRGSAWYRGTVAANYLRGFFLETEHDRVPRLSDRPSGTLLTPTERVA